MKSWSLSGYSREDPNEVSLEKDNPILTLEEKKEKIEETKTEIEKTKTAQVESLNRTFRFMREFCWK